MREKGSKIVCFCPCPGSKHCPNGGEGGGQKMAKICPRTCWMPPLWNALTFPRHIFNSSSKKTERSNHSRFLLSWNMHSKHRCVLECPDLFFCKQLNLVFLISMAIQIFLVFRIEGRKQHYYDFQSHFSTLKIGGIFRWEYKSKQSNAYILK